jgi:hypothetical protein
MAKKKKRKDSHNRHDAEVQAPSSPLVPEPSGGYVQPDLALRHIPAPF